MTKTFKNKWRKQTYYLKKNDDQTKADFSNEKRKCQGSILYPDKLPFKFKIMITKANLLDSCLKKLTYQN